MMNIGIISLILMCSGVAIMASKQSCPPKDKLTCLCETNTGGIDVSCVGHFVKSEEELYTNLQALKGYNLDALLIRDLTLKKAEVNMFEGLSMSIDHLMFHSINVLEDSFKEGLEFFKGLENSLTAITIDQCYKEGTTLKYFKISHLKHLEFLAIDQSKVEEVGNDWFPDGPYTLKFLTLDNNGINKLGDKAFTSLTGLSKLSINDNNLSEITRGMFPQQAPRLRRIYLERNKISHFPTDTFHSMPNLYALHLEGNLITTLDEHIEPSGMEQIVKIFLTENPITCDEKIKWLCDTRKTNVHTLSCANPEEHKDKIFKEFCEM